MKDEEYSFLQKLTPVEVKDKLRPFIVDGREVFERGEYPFNPTDKQTTEIVQGILFLITNYPEVKLLVDYDKEIMMILPKETQLTEDEREILVRLGWENLEYYPWMWQFQVEGVLAEYY